MTDPNAEAKKRHKEDPTQCFSKEGRTTVEARLGLRLPYIQAVDTMLGARGTDGYGAARADVEGRARSARELPVADAILDRPDLKGRGLDAVVTEEAYEALRTVPEGAEKRGGVIATVLSERAKDAEERVSARMDDLVVNGVVTNEQAEAVSGYVASELLRLAGSAQEVNRLGGPRAEILEGVAPVGGQIDSSHWNAGVWEGIIGAARQSGRRQETHQTTGNAPTGAAASQNSEEQKKQTEPEEEGLAGAAKKLWDKYGDTVVAAGAGILLEKAGDLEEALVAEYVKDRALKREIELKRASGEIPPEPARPTSSATVADASPAEPRLRGSRAAGEAEPATLPTEEPEERRREPQEARRAESGRREGELETLVEKLTKALDQGGKAKETAVREFLKMVDQEVTAGGKCGNCGGPREMGQTCAYCSSPSRVDKMVQLAPVLESFLGDGVRMREAPREERSRPAAATPAGPETEEEGGKEESIYGFEVRVLDMLERRDMAEIKAWIDSNVLALARSESDVSVKSFIGDGTPNKKGLKGWVEANVGLADSEQGKKIIEWAEFATDRALLVKVTGTQRGAARNLEAGRNDYVNAAGEAWGGDEGDERMNRLWQQVCKGPDGKGLELLLDNPVLVNKYFTAGERKRYLGEIKALLSPPPVGEVEVATMLWTLEGMMGRKSFLDATTPAGLDEIRDKLGTDGDPRYLARVGKLLADYGNSSDEGKDKRIEEFGKITDVIFEVNAGDRKLSAKEVESERLKAEGEVNTIIYAWRVGLIDLPGAPADRKAVADVYWLYRTKYWGPKFIQHSREVTLARVMNNGWHCTEKLQADKNEAVMYETYVGDILSSLRPDQLDAAGLERNADGVVMGVRGADLRKIVWREEQGATYVDLLVNKAGGTADKLRDYIDNKDKTFEKMKGFVGSHLHLTSTPEQREVRERQIRFLAEYAATEELKRIVETAEKEKRRKAEQGGVMSQVEKVNYLQLLQDRLDAAGVNPEGFKAEQKALINIMLETAWGMADMADADAKAKIEAAEGMVREKLRKQVRGGDIVKKFLEFFGADKYAK